MAAAARTAGHIGTEPGERIMTRHGVIQSSATGTQPPATNPRVLMAVIDADRAAPSRPPGPQSRTEEQRSGLSASMSALPDGGRAIADTSQKPKSP